MSDNMEDKYPHWRDALFGEDGAVANVRCAIHYVAWHGVYGLLAAFAFFVISVVKTLFFIGDRSGPLSGYITGFASWLVNGIKRVIFSDYMFYTIATLCGALLLGIAGLAIYEAIQYGIESLWILAEAIGIILAVIAFWVILMYIYVVFIQPALGYAGSKAKETPGIRRIYGNCPVSLSQPPKWFDTMFEEENE